MKTFRAFLLLLIVLSTNAKAAMVWSDNNPWGSGLGVNIVYPSPLEKSVFFMASNGNLYQYKWDANQTEITPNAKAVYAMLLTAFTTGSKVSIYYDNAQSGQINFTLINLHN